MKRDNKIRPLAARPIGSIAACAILALGLAGCSSDAGPKERGGAVVGGVVGGLAGSTIGSGSGRLVAVGVGAILGSIIGSEVGKSLDRADRAYMHETTQHTLESRRSGETSEWVNPDNGHRGSVTPEPAYRASDGRYCREFQQTVTIDGRTERAYGTACRQPDGSWQIVS